ncbi:MAG: hypothetical protein UW32_C0001G0471 [Candidatus Wolfebacteria bacterium GW2011_GWE2_44_13]|uniref:Uncharacterized protein n=1 Tax=Candidatus Wolfebacteria bacterium GW2011_GWE2_44_13 TaxID=1619017 RepID=A0A0G1K7N2_9BACT|nr:MAG: hypothetical protein UW32_C0001G0471 [Candidatus Wolfebacteria bacterium GW2011_GWE2_44_13]
MFVIPVQTGIQAFVLFQKSTSVGFEKEGSNPTARHVARLLRSLATPRLKTVNSLLRTAQTTQFLRKFFSPILSVIFTDAWGIRINAPLIRNIFMFVDAKYILCHSRPSTLRAHNKKKPLV